MPLFHFVVYLFKTIMGMGMTYIAFDNLVPSEKERNAPNRTERDKDIY